MLAAALAVNVNESAQTAASKDNFRISYALLQNEISTLDFQQQQ
jgi:hypothetical protein